jgi:hypothetical protein
MARLTGTSQAAVSAVERGVQDVTTRRVQRLLAAAGWHLVGRRAGTEGAPEDLELLRLDLTRTPAARLAGFFNLVALRGVARR